MNLFEILKQFKTIEPDSAYAETSKRAILAATPKEKWGPRGVITRIFQTGIAVGLAALFILFVTGQFSNAPYISPAQFSVINPETLHAEAQAVDIQIQLAQVAYEEATTTESTPSAASIHPAAFGQKIVASASTTASVQSSSSETASSSVSIDDALRALSQ